MKLTISPGGNSAVSVGGGALLVLVAAGAVALAAMNLRDIQRYLKIRNM